MYARGMEMKIKEFSNLMSKVLNKEKINILFLNIIKTVILNIQQKIKPFL